MVIEVWLPVADNPLYEVSNLGRVFSKRSDKILKPFKVGRGYLMVTLGVIGKRYVHRLVYATFVKPIPSTGVVRHLDNEVTNNYPYNLLWGTHKANSRQMSMEKRQHLQKLSRQDVDEIRETHCNYPNLNKSALGRRYGVTCATICKVINFQTHK